jgi:alanyl-tRNA synthetase
MGSVSKELCGGTHVAATGQIGLFHITQESSISAGVRRIEALTGHGSARCLAQKETAIAQLTDMLKASEPALVERVKALLDKTNDLEIKLAAASAAQASLKVAAIVDEALALEGALKWSVYNLGVIDKKSFGDILNGVSDTIKQKKLDNAAFVLGAVADGAVMLAACAGPKASRELGVHCGEIVKAASLKVGGSGGGSPTRAQAGGKDPSKIDEALAEAAHIITSKTKAAH